MKIDKHSIVYGIPASTLRDALRKNQYTSHSSEGFARLLKLDLRATKRVIQRLAKAGLISRTDHDAWKNTDTRQVFANPSAGPKISRKAVEKAGAGLIEQAHAITREPMYALTIQHIAVFGVTCPMRRE